MNELINSKKSFFRYVIVSGLATAVDFGVLVLLTEVFGIWYLFSATIGAISGGVVGFLLGRNWAFMSTGSKAMYQAVKYSLVWIGSILLNVGLLYIIVEWIDIQYVIAKIIVAIVVGLGYNYTLQKYYIFKENN